MKFFDVAIIGGGASGLACASHLAELNKNLNIAVIDAGERLGKKLASTGNGQGNVTNKNMGVEHYFGGMKHLVESIACTTDKIYLEEQLFKCMLVADEQGRVYPGGKQASSLCDSLIADLKRANVEVLLSTKVKEINKSKNFEIILSDNSKIFAKYAVLCVGGKAQKQFKTDGSSYALAQGFGHTLTNLYPSLVQLKTDTTHIKTLKGIRADCNLSAFVNGKKVAEKRGDIIFTDYGVSGNAVFYISAFIVDKQDATLSIEFLPQVSGIEKDIIRKKSLGYEKSELLSGTLHNQIGRAIIKRCNTDDEKIIANTVKNFTLPVIGTLGFDYAQVTKGGVKMEEISNELESKFAKNLFLAGEILDVDGECGGYNLHWAFASGYTVAEAIAKREK
ncbi:MAG: aminoacetone oxidase family FAD-binding enzyme [Clostridiales bacterium]|nr:aminoacetone oxidase family FAD-binding enzyme [Clostridiales bacterium]